MKRSRFTEEQIAYALRQVEAWRKEYNSYRPHSSLGGMTPSAFEAEGYTPGAASKPTG